ncbi:hypothetical protein CRG98_019631 [Punica granatum]|uniref:Uncharacterized protein n=1 Tax=Punica granatum TaxID=22663 RepID=A0A2I0JUI2_PUNGR|nr:hypothetical protein CRG98_019631 [Punica granatum]
MCWKGTGIHREYAWRSERRRGVCLRWLRKGRDRRVDLFRNINVISFCHPETLTSRVAVGRQWNLAGAVDVESAHWMRKGRRSASAGTSCRPPSCLITRPRNMNVLPKWLRRGTPTIPGYLVIMGPPGFHRATHRKRTSINSPQKRLHSEKLCSGGRMTGTRRSISERSSAM